MSSSQILGQRLDLTSQNLVTEKTVPNVQMLGFSYMAWYTIPGKWPKDGGNSYPDIPDTSSYRWCFQLSKHPSSTWRAAESPISFSKNSKRSCNQGLRNMCLRADPPIRCNKWNTSWFDGTLDFSYQIIEKTSATYFEIGRWCVDSVGHPSSSFDTWS